MITVRYQGVRPMGHGYAPNRARVVQSRSARPLVEVWSHDMKNRARFIILILLAVTTVTACQDGGDGGDLNPADAVATTEVDVVDNSFEPSVIQVATGDTVTWTWGGQNPHDVDGGEFASEVQTSGTFSHTFETAGEYSYVCNVHAGMDGLVVVEG
jgi:plastocyanin